MKKTVHEIKCLKDIMDLGHEYPQEFIDYITNDFKTIKEWADEDKEYTLENYNTDYSGNGYIVVLNGNESVEELENRIGLTGGLVKTIPEVVNIYEVKGTLWRRMIVIYNDSFANIIWIPNYDGLDSYAV